MQIQVNMMKLPDTVQVRMCSRTPTLKQDLKYHSKKHYP